MATLALYNSAGKKVEDLEVSEDVFGLKMNNDLLHQAYVAIQSNQRQVIAHTKNRGERAGSGKKPWKQKGTGNARVGSVRNPVWRKGGIIFGPTKDRNFKKDINKKMMQKAICIALSAKVKSGALIAVDTVSMVEKKTKKFAEMMTNLKVKGSSLIGFHEKEKDAQRYSKNIKKVTNALTSNLNVFDILNSKNLILSKDSIQYLEKKYSKR
jgi:large subunit ribosomal protein L4